MQVKTLSNSTIVWSQESAATLSAEAFSVDYWQQHNNVVGQSKGRYTTWFVQTDAQHHHQQWVLRHYWRGGMMEKLSRDAYFYTGLTRTRAYAELALLALLYQEGFPVPNPIAAKIERFGLWYRADIIIERVAKAKDLVAHLSKTALSEKHWHTLGKTIAKFHQRGVYHADLNAKNILISENGFHLIDFDRGEIKPLQASWQQANLKRLLRSFNKEQSKQPQLQFTTENWQQLLAGYNTINPIATE
ncbi:3-deoxy-D-manno-octulosonic acid kinase [Shewanella gaetbuli]|uniref:3-deoxy-D-manno-octulosonic acid kinase n=1 Tax=Shewanella gaetbuli TaxID=220752 RepID=A0A9X1ZMR4_9GAMM|nr:3-deoxy-D-manno-octulosonic acid kinase [Shewanella gaetbuli]MCL1142755.1 3-deoxy-D-manno-octulosonic acid kinase [Shewanella gaetbuli]